MEIKRGYKKWWDEDGVFHKEPVDPELNAEAEAAAEEAREVTVTEPASAAEEPDADDKTHDEALRELREKTA